MIKKITAFGTMAALLFCSWSCVTYRWEKTSLQSMEPEKRAKAKISAVQTKSGEKIEFGTDPPARIEENSVVGEKSINNIVLEKSKIKTPKNLPRFFPLYFNITTTDGGIYRVTYYREEKDVIIFNGYLPFSIALSDIDRICIKKFNVLATLLVELVLSARIFIVFAGIGLSSKL